jgi:hypothetical protein
MEAKEKVKSGVARKKGMWEMQSKELLCFKL